MPKIFPNEPVRQRLHISTVHQAHKMLERLVVLRKMENAIESGEPCGARLTIEQSKAKDAPPESWSPSPWLIFGTDFAAPGKKQKNQLTLTIDARALLPAINAEILAIERTMAEMGVEV